MLDLLHHSQPEALPVLPSMSRTKAMPSQRKPKPKPKPKKKGLFDGPAWPRDNTSDYGYNSSTASSAPSSDCETIISDDLDLYDARYVC